MARKQYVGIFRPPNNRWWSDRTLLQRAGCIALSLEKAHKTMWSGLRWPAAHCLNTSLIDAVAIRMSLEWPVRVVVGRTHNNRPHAWIVTPDNDIIDPTFGMFDDGPALRILPANRNWILGHWPETELTREQEERFRDSVQPLTPGSRGWAEDSGVYELFGDYPF